MKKHNESEPTRGIRFYCPGCDKFIGADCGPINGAHYCDSCKAKRKKET